MQTSQRTILTIRTTLFSAIFWKFGTVVLDFLTLQDKHNIRTLSVNIKFSCTRCETDQENSPDARLLFFLFQKLVQINLISADNVCILSTYPVLVLFDWTMFLLYTITDQNIVLLVPDSCSATLRNDNIINNNIENI